MQTAEWQKSELIKKWKTRLSKICTCTEDYFVLCNEPETCLQKKKIPQVFVNIFCWAEVLRSVSSPYLLEDVSEFQFYIWTYIFFSGGKNIDGL